MLNWIARTNIFIAPSVAPPIYGGYGYGGSPVYSYGPSVVVGGGGDFIYIALGVVVAVYFVRMIL